MNGSIVVASLGLTGILTLGTLKAIPWFGLQKRLRTALQPDGTSVLAGQLLDATSTAFSIAWLGYGEKHPVVDAFIRWTGTAYTFIPLKLVVVLLILAVMNDDMRSDDPVFYNLIMVGILAIGLGPGTRNLTRAFLGV